jgi:SH3-like domain-containing protein
MLLSRKTRALPILAVVIACTLGGAAPSSSQDTRTGPSGLPVPRWVSLKFDKVNARAGPGDDHRLLWVYRVRNLPVQVIQETTDWRRVCDPDGGLAWVHKRTTNGERTAMNLNASALPLAAGPNTGAAVRALWTPRSLGALKQCKGGWCQVQVGDARGWVRQGAVWGGKQGAVCRRPG